MAADAPVAIVTGGSQGIGAAICVVLLQRGYKLCVADIQEVKGKQFVDEQKAIHGSGNVVFSYCDVTKEDDFTKAFELSMHTFHKVDILINNAGILLEQDPQKVLNVNLMGTIIGCQMAMKYMGKSNNGKGGMVINIASILGFLPFSAAPVYVASKHGIIGLTRSYGLPYHEKEGVIFTALCPSYTNTELLTNLDKNTLVPGLDVSGHPNVLSPDFVAEGVVKLLEDRINGSTLVVTKSSGYYYVGYQKEFENISFQ